MSSSTRHVAEQPDILAADAPWRNQLLEIVEGLAQNMPGMKHLLGISEGTEDDAHILFNVSDQLMNTLFKLEERQIAAVDQLEQHQAAWDTAIASRSGTLGKLDARLTELKNDIEQSKGTLQSLTNQKQQVESLLTSLKQRVSSAEAALKETQSNEVLIKVTRETKQKRLDELESRLAKQKEALDKQEKEQEATHTAKISAFQAEERGKREDIVSREKELEGRERNFESTRASKETELAKRRTDLDVGLDQVRARENDVADSEARVQQAKRRNDTESQNLRSALSILQGLANATGSGYDAVPTLNNILGLAASIETRCKTLQESCSERDHTLVDNQEHLSKVEATLQSTTQELGTLTINHEREMKKFNSLKQKKFKTGATVGELAELRKKLADKTAEHGELLGNYATLDSHRQSYTEQLKKAKETRETDQALISGLQSFSIPKLEATEKALRSRVTELTKENRGLTAGRTASDVEIREVKVKNQELETTLQELRTQLSAADESRTLMKNSFNTLLNRRNMVADVNYQSHQRSLQGLNEVKAINDSLNTSLRAANEERQIAANDISALKREISELRVKFAAANILLGERDTKIQDLELAVDETKTKMTALESQCGEKDIIIGRLEDESKAGERIAGLRSEIERKDSRISALESQCGEMDIIIGRLKDESRLAASNAGERIAGLKSDIEQKNSQITTLESRCGEKNATVTRLEHEFKLAASDDRKMIARLGSDIEQKDSRIQALEEGRRSLQADKGTLNTSINGLKEELKTLGQELKTNQELVGRFSTSLSDQKAATLQLELQVTRDNGLKEQLSAKSAEIANAEATHQEVAKENQRLSKALGDLKEQNAKSLRTTKESNLTLKEQADGCQEELDRLKTDMRKLRVEILPGKETTINHLKSKVAEQERQASASQQNLKQRINDLNTKVLTLEVTIQEQEKANAENDLLLRENIEMRAAVDKCELEHSEVDQTIEEIRAQCEATEGELHTQLESLTAQLQNCQCSDRETSHKRVHGQMDSGEEEASSAGHSQRKTRRLEKAPELAVDVTATTAGSSVPEDSLDEPLSPGRLGSSGPAGSRPLMNTPVPRALGTTNATITPSDGVAFTILITDIKRLNFSSDVIPNEVPQALRRRVVAWDSKSAVKWDIVQSLEGGRSCIEARMTKKRSRWDNGTGYACFLCDQRMRLCIVVHSTDRVLLLPRKAAEDEGRGPTDTKYWTK